MRACWKVGELVNAVFVTLFLDARTWFKGGPSEQIPFTSNGFPSSPGRRAAVASENRECSQIGIDLISAGGNAADALVGTVFCIGVLDCHHSGIGGGGFALARSPDGRYEGIDFREAAPDAAHKDMYKDNVNASLVGGLASAVPGELKGLDYIHRMHGSLPWSQILQPSIRLALDGFTVSEDFATAMNASEEEGGFLTQDPAWAEDFAPMGARLQVGEMMTRKRYGHTLEKIAKEGPNAFYFGPLAEATVQALRNGGGVMDVTDLHTYDVKLRTPIEVKFKGHRISSIGVPASGAVVLSILKILDGYRRQDHDSRSLKIHRTDEAMRFGYGKRTNLADPEFVSGMDDLEAEMLSDRYTSEVRAKISDSHTLNVSAYDPDGLESSQDHGTSQVVTADASGMAFSFTTSINWFFGSKVIVPETGVILNNVMNDFSIPNVSNVFGYYPSPANYIRPGKRPLSSNSPLIIEYPDGTLCSVLGASGGSRIITTNVQNALHFFDSNMSMQETLASPRFHDQLIPNTINFDHWYDKDIFQSMLEKGHRAVWAKVKSSGQGLRIRDGIFEASGEPRQHNSGGLII